MFQILFVLIFQSFYTSQILGSEHCDESKIFKSYFDVAVDFINKAKSHFPEGSIIPQEKSCPPMDCEEVLRSGHKDSGVYTIWPRSRLTNKKPLEVYCDMDTDGGGWTVIQRRGDFNRPEDYFFRNWSNYKNGFGDIKEDFWLGNDNIFALTNQREYSIRFDLKSMEGEKKYALYDIFWIDSEDYKYTLHIQGYSGDAGDSMNKTHANQKFSTKDQDNDNGKDRNCSLLFKGGWWYGNCYDANLNGLYDKDASDKNAEGVTWRSFRGVNESLSAAEMKIRPKNFNRKLITIPIP